MSNSLYHSFLRVAVSVVALALVFDSGLLFSSTADVSKLVQYNVANVVGVTVGVAPNEVNQLTARITELETELQAKERLIGVNVQNNPGSTLPDKSTFILSAILFILLVLIVLNYILDYLRNREVKTGYEKTTSQVA